VPLVHTGHTWAAVKNAWLAPGDVPEPPSRSVAEAAIVAEAQGLFANTRHEAAQLHQLYGADVQRTYVVSPGVDLERFHPADSVLSRRRYGIDDDAFVVLFVGRVQPLKSPDVVLRAAALLAANPELRRRLVVIVCGGRSGSHTGVPLVKLAAELGIGDLVRFTDPMPAPELSQLYRAADVTVVPSRNESFGLVALESQASGTPVVAATGLFQSDASGWGAPVSAASAAATSGRSART
jgi:D-inositol-3-phosphate glycosyltransferase